jgi:hypothetical protein
MKKIRIEKKLFLKKEKIASLSNEQMSKLQGGEKNTVGCPTTACPSISRCGACGNEPGYSVAC